MNTAVDIMLKFIGLAFTVIFCTLMALTIGPFFIFGEIVTYFRERRRPTLLTLHWFHSYSNMYQPRSHRHEKRHRACR